MDPEDRRPLRGFAIGITGHRRWEEQAEMLTRRGARVVHGPVMATMLLGDLDATLDATRRVTAAPVDTVVLTTGIGTRSWFAAAESAGLEDELRACLGAARVVARGPKALNAARAAGLEVAWSAPSETNDEVFAVLAAEGVTGQRLVVQRDGGAPLLADELAGLDAAEVLDVPVYRWHVPDDVGPAARLLGLAVDRQLDAVTFTCSYAVHNAFGLADDPQRLADAFRRDVLPVAVGPVTAAALRANGVDRVVEPRKARLGAMVHAMTTALGARSLTLGLGATSVRLQGTTVIGADGQEVELTRGEARVLRVLADHAPTVVPKAALVEHGADDHAAEVAVARVRAKLGPLGAGIRTVRRRGYACTLDVAPAGQSVATATD